MRIEVLEQIQAQILSELRLLRRGKPRADVDSVEALLGYIHGELGDEPWTTAQVFEAALENCVLHGAIVRCIGEGLSIPRLAKSLMRHLGEWGIYYLRCVNRHSNSGARFTVTKLRHFVTTKS